MSTAKRLVWSLRGRKQSQDSSAGHLVSGFNTNDGAGCHELEEINVISRSADPLQVKYGECSGSSSTTCNGPRLVPGIVTSGRGCMAGERLRNSGGGLDVANTPSSSISTSKTPVRSNSKTSLLSKSNPGMSRCDGTEESHFHHDDYLFASRDSIPAAYINRAANVSSSSELDIVKSRKQRRKETMERLKLPPSVSLASYGNAPLLGGWRKASGSTAGGTVPSSSTNHLSNNSCNCRESRGGLVRGDTHSGHIRSHGCCGQSFIFDPAGRLCYYWSMIVSLACLYNLWVIVYRFSFKEIDGSTLIMWFFLDYFADFLYLMDIMIHFRTGYLEDGVLQTDTKKLSDHYISTPEFYLDGLSLLPCDVLYICFGFNSIFRVSRLIKLYRVWIFMDRTERHTNYPNFIRSVYLIHTILVVFHWNGCVFHLILKNNGFGSRNWVYSDTNEEPDHVKAYLQSYYWCTLALTTVGDLPRPRNKSEYLFVIFQLLFGLLLFATVMGHVANIVTSVSSARKEFQAKLDGVKTYMRMRSVPDELQIKVIKWFDYLWMTQKCSDEDLAVSCLPEKLKAEIAMNVHLDTLKRVEIFQNTEAGFLCELVLKLRPVLFSPGDYICRKGEVGKEMYIVNRGRLQVVADNGRTVLAHLMAGCYFGEISVLNMGTAGNRRTASVRSVGYSDLFVLNKRDLWDVLKDYPAARVRLEAIAVKRLEKYKRAPLEKVAMGRSQSTPGLVESRGRVTLEDMWIPPLPLSYLYHRPASTSALTPPHISQQPQHTQLHQQQQQQQQLPQSSSHMFLLQQQQQQQQQQLPQSTSTSFLLQHQQLPQSSSSSSYLLQQQQYQPQPSLYHQAQIQPQTQLPLGQPQAHMLPLPVHTPESPMGSTCSDRSPQSRQLATRSGFHGGDSMTQLVSGRTTPLIASHELLENELIRLRERLERVESENTAMSLQLAQQRWDLEFRMHKIQKDINGSNSTSSLEQEELERNRESII